jgi:NAD(P)-dependent dehydrogenase (short-subunit alcohol dehydrogenase family)
MSLLNGKTALITGGTKGLGKAIGMAFARAGARVFLTHKWGSVDEAELITEFKQQHLALPYIIQADASDSDDLLNLINQIKEHTDTLDIIISNVAFSKIITDFLDFKRQSLELSIKYSAWPIVDLIQKTNAVLQSYPRYVLAISSDGPDICHLGYDMAGTSKAVLETLCRYLALRLKQHGVRVNALRPGFLDTASSRATFGNEIFEKLQANGCADIFLSPDDIAKTCVAFCSGFMDSVTGQVLNIDEGWSLVSPIALVTGSGLPGAFPN